MECKYCGGEKFNGIKCIGCGSRNSTESTASTPSACEKSAPFFFNGFMVYAERNPATWDRQFFFWLGDRLVDVVYISRDLWFTLFPGWEAASTDSMQFVWNMFLVQQGEKKDFIVEMANRNNDTFASRRRGGEIVLITRRQTEKEVAAQYSDIPWDELVKMRDMKL